MKRWTLAVGLWVSGVTAAQGRTWVVDQGGGGQFTEIQPAIDAASPGDRVLVRGTFTYQGFTLSKGLDLEATQGATVNGVAIRLVPLGQWARVAGLQVINLGVERCAGPVLLASLTVSSSYGQVASIVTCQCVLVLDCVMTGGADSALGRVGGSPGLRVLNAQVTLQRTRLVGGAGLSASMLALLSSTPGGAGLSITGGSVLVATSTCTGGTGGNGNGFLSPSPGGPGITMGAADLLVSAASALAGGAYGQPSAGTPGLALAGDPAYPAAARITAECTRTGAVASATAVPMLPYFQSPGAAQLGGPATITLNAAAGSVALAWFATTHDHVPMSGVEGALLLAPPVIGLFPLTVGSSGSLPLTFPVPNSAALRNQFAFFQALALPPAPAGLVFTNLADLRLR